MINRRQDDSEIRAMQEVMVRLLRLHGVTLERPGVLFGKVSVVFCSKAIRLRGKWNLANSCKWLSEWVARHGLSNRRGP